MKEDSFIQSITKEIMEDEQNLEFTKEGFIPFFSVPVAARIVIVGQAPGIKAVNNGRCWYDQSGKRLRDWLGVDEDRFYNSGKFAIIPMDFYYPGKGKSGDLPPRKGFAKKWHEKLINHCKDIELLVLVGSYAQEFYLGDKRKKTLTETVFSYKEYLPRYFPLVHPSPRNGIWLSRNLWFEQDVVPRLKDEVRRYID